MRKPILILTVFSLLFAMGCTQIPVSEETGLGPGQYEGIAGTEEIKKENLSLKEELDGTRIELDDVKIKLEELEDEYLSLAKSNENIIFKLEEAESKLRIVQSEDIPRFNSESTDAGSIVSYLETSSKLIDDSVKGIEIIETGENIVFRTRGYGDEYSQIFIWDEGETEPVLIEGASFDRDGSFERLGSFILIKSSDGKNKVLDIGSKKLTGSFEEPQKMQFLEGTETILLKDKDSKLVLYDFVNDSNKQINLDNNKYTDFNLENDSLVFTGAYTENDVEYEMKATFALDKMIEAYEIQRTGQAIDTGEIEDTP